MSEQPLDPVTEQHLADMPDDDWRALVARVRPPDDPKAVAAKALAHHVRGKSPEYRIERNQSQVADAVRGYITGGRA